MLQSSQIMMISHRPSLTIPSVQTVSTYGPLFIKSATWSSQCGGLSLHTCISDIHGLGGLGEIAINQLINACMPVVPSYADV